MNYMLDTDTVSLIIRKYPSVIEKLIKHEDDEICISTITYAELCYGLEKKGSVRLFNEIMSIIRKFTIVDFDNSQAELYGKIRVGLEKSGTPLGNMDMLIAASALAAGAILITHNTKHFSKINGLKVEDWYKP
ncbi:MAG: type II toxin-antitoxin system VapC family toxin [Spirochaetes bacterium]|nr:type II toxin-antitoxin system VapC family toxin [Spirochaetota bacterium]